MLELKPAPGSSFELVKIAIEQKRVCCVVIANNFNVYVHHDSWHQTLQNSIGTQWDESLGDGNFSLVTVDHGIFLVVRWKADKTSLAALLAQRLADDLLQKEFGLTWAKL